jgi:transposase-like protein
MTQYQLTLDSELLYRLFGDNEQVARLLEQVLNQVLEAQRSDQVHAEPYERTEDRRGYRNGYKPRQLTTRVGTLTLRVPQVREGTFSSDLFARYQRSEQALILTLMEMVVNGVSTRKEAHITEELCGREFAKSTVSDLCKRLDPLVDTWNERDLRAHCYPFVLVDGLVIKVREGGHIVARSALLAIGVNALASVRSWACAWVTANRNGRGWTSSRGSKGAGCTAWISSSQITMVGSSMPFVSSFRAPPGSVVRCICPPT